MFLDNRKLASVTPVCQSEAKDHLRIYRSLSDKAALTHIEQAKSNYYNNLLQDYKGDSSKLSKVFKQFLPSK